VSKSVATSYYSKASKTPQSNQNPISPKENDIFESKSMASLRQTKTQKKEEVELKKLTETAL
jgi:hypothetical protein